VTALAATPDAVARALGDVATFGPFFVIATEPAPARAACSRSAPASGGGWRPFTALHEAGGPVRELVAAYARRLGTPERRVAASILFQGLAARLWSPVVATAVAHGVVPDLSGLRYQWAPGAPVGLWLAAPAGRALDGSTANGEPAAAVHRAVLGQLLPLRAAMRSVVAIADGLIWGNAASALAGVHRSAAAARPGLDGPLADIIERLLALPPLVGAGELVRPFPERPDRFYVRRNCCLYYRVPPGGDYCGDCVLLDPERRARQWRAAAGGRLT
jgi:hypothetical protein